MGLFEHIEIEIPHETGLDPIVADQFRNEAASFHQSGIELLQRGYVSQAADMLERALGFREHDFQLWIDAIEMLVRADKLERAEARSHEALQNYRRTAPLFAAHALVLAHRGQFGDALGHVQVVFDHARRGTHWYAHAIRGEILLRQDKTNRGEATYCFDQAMDGQKNPWRAALIAAWAFLDAELPVFAAAAAAEVAHWNPRACIGWLLMARCFEQLRLYEQAQFYYGCVLELEPNHPAGLRGRQSAKAARFGLLSLFRRENLKGRWRTAYERALQQTGRRP